MGTIFGTILAFLIVFGILVFIHEFGHFLMAKLAGVRVEVFSFGYGKRLFGRKKGHTDYRVSILPMGGYVKFLGEGMYEAGRPLEPDDFMAKTRLERFLVIAMGPVMNIVLAIVLVAAVNMAGVTSPVYLDQPPVIGWIDSGSPAEKSGLRSDDEILAVNGRKVPSWSEVEIAVGTRPEREISLEIRRAGETMTVPLMTEKRTRYDMGYAGFYGKIQTQVQMVSPGSPAEKGGLEPGDVVKAIDGETVYFYKFIEVLEKNPDKELEFLVDRGGRDVTLNVTPRREGSVGKIGVLQTAQSVTKSYGFFAAFGQSWRENKRLAFLIVDFIKNLVTGQTSVRQVGGPLEIAKFSYSAMRMGFWPLISWIALISLQLGMLNLFPIPVFDGGQLFVLAIEGIFRRDLAPKARQVWMQVGFVIFIVLIAFIILNDFVKRLPNGWSSLVPF
ncbi:MAG: RIP metalloprotease RseP [Candidatus Aminicenantes bacterium]|nr:RIP metalloprotease RseP [Candidatus Aminicenantes bacterium]